MAPNGNDMVYSGSDRVKIIQQARDSEGSSHGTPGVYPGPRLRYSDSAL